VGFQFIMHPRVVPCILTSAGAEVWTLIIQLANRLRRTTGASPQQGQQAQQHNVSTSIHSSNPQNQTWIATFIIEHNLLIFFDFRHLTLFLK
jgi:hypothetical protein